MKETTRFEKIPLKDLEKILPLAEFIHVPKRAIVLAGKPPSKLGQSLRTKSALIMPVAKPTKASLMTNVKPVAQLRKSASARAEEETLAVKLPILKGAVSAALKSGFDPLSFLAKAGLGKSTVTRSKGETVFSQGDDADSVFYVQKGKVKIGVVSQQGKEAIVAILGPGEFVGEDCIATSHPLRLVTATSMTDCSLLKIDKKEMIKVLSDDHAFSEVFVTFLLARNARIQEDLIDQLFNSSEKRLARVLLLLAQFGKDGKPEVVIPNLSQETLAEMVGTTRSRVSFFMNRFRKLGFIEYDGEIKVHSSLLNVILHD